MVQPKITDFFSTKKVEDKEKDGNINEEELIPSKDNDKGDDVDESTTTTTKKKKGGVKRNQDNREEEEDEATEEEDQHVDYIVKNTSTNEKEDNDGDDEEVTEKVVKKQKKEETAPPTPSTPQKKAISLKITSKKPAASTAQPKEEKQPSKEEKQQPKQSIRAAVTSNPSSYDDLPSCLTDGAWKSKLDVEFTKPYFKTLIGKLNGLVADPKAKPIYPPKDEIFTALNLSSLDNVKVVIVGQDPYHGKGQAHGLSFSVKKGVVAPPSLKNMYKELETDIPGFKAPNHGFLEHWARQGVLMLNAVLTVDEKTPNSHKDFGWEKFTDAVLTTLNNCDRPIVFILWGQFAQKKASSINKKKHHVIESAHPSPFSATKFFGSKPFSKTNTYLKSIGSEEIDWNLPLQI